jgi:hypothetical protein
MIRTTTSVPRIHKLLLRLGSDAIAEIVALYIRRRSVDGTGALIRAQRVVRGEASGNHNVARRRQGLSSAQLGEAAQLYESGWSVAKIGRIFGVNGTTVWRAFVVARLQMRSPNESS